MNNDLQSKYPWAVNVSKLERAVKEVLDKGIKESDEAVKTVYKRLLGKIAGEDSNSSSQVSLNDLSLADLKKIAKSKGVKVTGTKEELIKGIQEAEKLINDDIDSDDDVETEDLTGDKKDEDDE